MPAKHFHTAVIGRVEAQQKAEQEKIDRIRQEEAEKAKPEAQPERQTPIITQAGQSAKRQSVTTQTDEPATLRLGQINERLSPITLTAQRLADLGIEPAATERASKLYRESDFVRICDALIEHVEQVGSLEVV